MAKIQVTYPGIEDAYVQVAGTMESNFRDPIPGRYQVGTFHGRDGVERFELHAGDYWQGAGSSDAINSRERIEARDEVEPRASADAPWMSDEFSLFLDPAEFPTHGPDVKLFQFFDEANSYPIAFLVMRTGGRLELLINSKRSDAGKWRGHVVAIPFEWSAWNRYLFVILPRKGANAAALGVVHNDKPAFAAEAMSLIEDDAVGIYAKHGLYRSDVDEWQTKNGGALPPTVASYVHGRKRSFPPASQPQTPPVPVTPAPQPSPAPAPAPGPVDAEDRDLEEAREIMEGLETLKDTVNGLRARQKVLLSRLKKRLA